MNYFNIMTYDYNGGWSNKAGHNAPLYDYPGAEYSNFSLDATVKSLKQLGVNLSKVTVGAPFYGRGVNTASAAALNGATVKRAETIQPDGPVQTCADYTNWPVAVWAGTPNYSYILQTTGSGSGWTDHWDDVAKCPYMTKGNYFLSYDNPRSITAKAQYIKDNGLAGAIVWQVYGDMINMTSSTVAKGKLIYCPNTQSPLVNTINQVFAGGVTPPPGNTPPTVSITAPTANASFTAPASITLQATASDADGTVAKVEFFNGATSLGSVTAAPYSITWSNVAAGTYSLTAIATDNSGAVTTSAAVSITVNSSTGGGTGNCAGVATWSASAVYTGGNQVVYNGNLYTAKWWTQGNQPDINTGDGLPWTLVGACSGTTPGNTPPTVSLTAPTANASFTAPASITLQATASDADGTIAKVQFFNGSTSLGAVTAAPYSFTWSNVAAGTYSLTAVATDNGGATTTSAAVSIQVTSSSGGGSGNCAGVPTYQPYPAVYNIGDKVVYNGNLYQSAANGLYNVTPGTADWWWTPLGACTSGTVSNATAKTASALPPMDANGQQGLIVYPNPVTGTDIQVQVTAQAGEKLSVNIRSVTGNAPVLQQEVAPAVQGVQLIRLNLGHLPAGIWILSVRHQGTGRTETAKVIRL
jgi:chitinase